jgi:CheY-like chemotaxis protein
MSGLESSVLFVDDDENDIFFLKRAFKDAGISNPLIVAHDGQEAIDYLSGLGAFSDRREYPLPCFLILDLKMPRKTGMDVLQWLRAEPVFRCLPVMILSSSAHRYDVERAYRLGANSFVVKPASVDKRTELARHIKGFWLNFNQPPLMCTEGFDTARQFHAEREVAAPFF